MVDMESVLAEVKRTAYVGAGTFASSTVGGFLDDYVPGGNLGVAAGQALAGAGVAVGADEYLDSRNTRGLDISMGEMVRHVGYGVGGAGFAEAGDAVSTGSSEQGQMVEVRTRQQSYSPDSGSSGGNDASISQPATEEPISLDV